MTMLSVVVAVALMPMPRSVEMRGGTDAANARPPNVPSSGFSTLTAMRFRSKRA